MDHQIHILYILKESGECIYSRIFSDQFQDIKIELITPFFSAFFTFSDKVLSEEIELLEMGDYKLLFRKNDNYIFSLQADNTMTDLFLNSRLDKIIDMFFFSFEEKGWNPDEVIEDPNFDSVIDEIVYGGVNLLKSIDIYRRIEGYFERAIKKNDIVGGALLTNTGQIIHSSLPDDILISSMKEMEIRTMSGFSRVPESFFTLENGQKIFSREIDYDKKSDSVYFVVVLLFDKSISLGMAEITLNKIAKELKTKI
ncbi:MAG: hypothetical protein ACOC44_00380 [Promethearchaeia archaeon]